MHRKIDEEIYRFSLIREVKERIADRYIERAKELFKSDKFQAAIDLLYIAEQECGVRLVEINELRKNIIVTAKAVRIKDLQEIKHEIMPVVPSIVADKEKSSTIAQSSPPIPKRTEVNKKITEIDDEIEHNLKQQKSHLSKQNVIKNNENSGAFSEFAYQSASGRFAKETEIEFCCPECCDILIASSRFVGWYAWHKKCNAFLIVPSENRVHSRTRLGWFISNVDIKEIQRRCIELSGKEDNLKDKQKITTKTKCYPSHCYASV